MKTKSKKLNLIWEELQDIFKDTKRYDPKLDKRLEKIGFKVVYNGKHPKLYFDLPSGKKVVVLSTTPSDGNTNKQTLREIRRIFENEECKDNQNCR